LLFSRGGLHDQSIAERLERRRGVCHGPAILLKTTLLRCKSGEQRASPWPGTLRPGLATELSVAQVISTPQGESASKLAVHHARVPAGVWLRGLCFLAPRSVARKAISIHHTRRSLAGNRFRARLRPA